MTALEVSSRYKVKGTALRNLQRFLDHHLEPGYFGDNARKIGLITSEMILPSSWYPAGKYYDLFEVASSDMEVHLKKFCRDFTRYMIKEDLNAIYKFFIKAAGVRVVLGKMSRMSTTYTNFADVEILLNEGSEFRARYTIVEAFSTFTNYQFEGGMSGILELFDCQLVDFEITEENKFLKEEELYSSFRVSFSYEKKSINKK